METLVEACQRERHAHSKDNQSHKPRRRVVQKAAAHACSAARQSAKVVLVKLEHVPEKSLPRT